MEKLKIGDIVTSVKGENYWLEGAYAEIVNIENNNVTVKIIDKSSPNISKYCPNVGKTDSGWKLEWLVKSDFKPLNNIKGEEKVMVKDFQVGDKVKVVKSLKISEVSIGDTAVIELDKDGDGDYKIRMDKDNDYWYADSDKIELINPKFEIITSGTTTTVKLEDGRVGVAKLYYKDTYNKGFGIVAALGKALGIDLIKEVQKVVGSYVIGIDLASDATMKFVGKFKVGDKIKGTKAGNDRYGTTDERVLEAEVTKVSTDGEHIDILINKYDGKRDKKDKKDFHHLESKYFELVENLKPKFEVGRKVKIPKTKQGNFNYSSYHVTRAKESAQEYLFLVEVKEGYSKDIYVLAITNEPDQGDFFYVEDLELYEEAPLKKPILKEETKTKVLTIGDFTIGDKVVPHAKNGCGYAEDFEDEGSWKAAKEKGQPYLYIIRFDEEKGKNILVLSDCKTETGGNYYLPTDVTQYSEPKEEVKIEPVIFKAGDTVRVREDLIAESDYYKGVIFRYAMAQYKGKTFKITAVDRYYYTLDKIGWNWTYDMLEKVEDIKSRMKFKVGDHIKFIKSVVSAKVGDTGVIEIVNEEDYKIRLDKVDDYWYADDEDVELIVEATPEKREFKNGDKVKLIHNSMDADLKIGDIAIIVDVRDQSNIRLEKDGNSMSRNVAPTDIELVAEDIEEEAIMEKEIKLGDKVKMISEHPGHGLGKVKVGDIGVVTRVKEEGGFKVDLPNQSNWNADSIDLELAVEPKEIVTEEPVKEEFKIGDYFYFEEDGEYYVCKINRIQDGKLYGDWTGLIKELPKTVREFESHPIKDTIGHMSIGNSSNKKLILIDDSVPEIKIGDEVSKEEAIKIIEAGGVVKSAGGLQYFEEDGVLKFKGIESNIISSGYSDPNFDRALTVISFKREIAAEKSELKADQELWDKFFVNDASVFCKTEDEANIFLKYCEEKEINWAKDSKATSHSNFCKNGTYYFCWHGKELVYSNGNSRSTTITFEELFAQEKIAVTEEEVSLTKTYEIGQKLTTKSEVEEFLKTGGKINQNGYIYYEKKGKLKYKYPDGRKEFSYGYDNVDVPATIFKLPKINN